MRIGPSASFPVYSSAAIHPSAYKTLTASNVEFVNAGDISGSAAGYIGGCHVGGYIYLAPFLNPSPHGYAVRVQARNTTFSTAASSCVAQNIAQFNAAAVGYTTACSDGRYVYYSPRSAGLLARHDTQRSFTSADGWEFFDLTRINASYKGYDGCIVLGNWLYLVPTNNGSYHGLALRFNLQANFFDPNSYQVVNLASYNANAVGYIGGCTDGRYVYFTPRQGAAAHGIFARYDSFQDFTAAAAWEFYDLGAVNALYKGYTDATFINGYIYYSPTNNGSYHGNAVRYNVERNFTDAGAWEVFNLASINALNIGYFGVGNDGRYVYYCPFYNGAYHGRLMRYDTTAPWGSASSWTTLDLVVMVDSALAGYTGIVSDGYSVFLVPYYNANVTYHSRVVRFTSTAPSRSVATTATSPARRIAKPAYAITVQTPQPWQVFQQSRRFGSVMIKGTHTGSRRIEASWNGSAWTPMSIAGESFSGWIFAAAGQGTLTVRDADDTSISTTVANVGVGNVFVAFGQSNASGRATNNQTYTPQSGITAMMFGNDYQWKQLVDPTDSYTNQVDRVSNDNYRYSVTVGGSCWMRVANWQVYRGYPIAFIPCALGGTGIVEFVPTADHFDRTTLYGSMAHRARLAGGIKAVLWWQGETDAVNNMTQATYNAYLDSIANAIAADFSAKLIPCTLLNCSALTAGQMLQINSAIMEAWSDNPNVYSGPDLRAIPSDDVPGYHYMLDATTNTVGDNWHGRIDNFLSAQGE